ncbi:MAG: ribosomal protein S18-alanine N-acetyltransferase [Betaproteobacteria bacterium]
MNAVVRPSEERFVPMTAADLDDVLSVENEVYPFPWTRANFVDSMRAGYCCWTLRDSSGALLSYSVVMLVLDEAHLLNLSVASNAHRLGYGWRMLEFMAQLARDHGARNLMLEVRPSNTPAQRLYRRYGFERIGVRRGYYPSHGGREDALVMRIAL